MTHRKGAFRFNQRAIRNWTLYVVRLENGHYYIGITSRKDFMRRINQHGGRSGAKVNRGHEVEEIIEVQQLGRMSGRQASNIENDVMLQYRRQHGARNVRGGHEIFRKTPLIPTYTPGSLQSFIFIIICLLLWLALFLLIVHSN